MDTLLGTLDYLFKPWLRSAAELHSWAWRGTGPMNGQHHRAHLALDIITGGFGCKGIVETGTYRGNTTEFLAGTGLPTRTIERDDRLAAYSRARLRKHRNITVHNAASEVGLWQIAAAENDFPTERVFFYLDAHWDAHIPLADELRAIQANWTDSIVMIDDFAVPGDSYRWLDRGPTARLDESSLGAWADKRRWYPATPAYVETGQNTGWVVLAQNDEIARQLDKLDGPNQLRRGAHVYQSVV